MQILDTTAMEWREKRPGWNGVIFSSANMTFAHWRFAKGAEIHRHDHEQEEVWHLIEGELDLVIDGVASRAGPGTVAVIPPSTAHSVIAASDGFAIVADYPLRPGF